MSRQGKNESCISSNFEKIWSCPITTWKNVSLFLSHFYAFIFQLFRYSSSGSGVKKLCKKKDCYNSKIAQYSPVVHARLTQNSTFWTRHTTILNVRHISNAALTNQHELNANFENHANCIVRERFLIRTRLRNMHFRRKLKCTQLVAQYSTYLYREKDDSAAEYVWSGAVITHTYVTLRTHMYTIWRTRFVIRPITYRHSDTSKTQRQTV